MRKRGTAEQVKRTGRCRRGAALLILALLLMIQMLSGALPEQIVSPEAVFAESLPEENSGKTEKTASSEQTGEKTSGPMLPADTELTPHEIERDYTKVMYSSADGLNGSTAVSIFADRDGLIWIGSYTGLYCYDGYSFREIPLADPIVGVTAITQDQDGRIWAGTNGDGIFFRENGTFVRIDPDNGVLHSVHAMVEDGADIIYAATTQGVYRVTESGNADDGSGGTAGKTGGVSPVRGLEGVEIRDLTVVNEGHIIAVTTQGEVYLIRDMKAEQFDMSASGFEGEIRCCGSDHEQDICYLGTGENQILKFSWEGKYLNTITSEKLSSFNAFLPVNDHEWWVCSDSGIGLIQDDRLYEMDLPMNDSVEEVCADYQGGYWFASSRQGMMKLYRNLFSDLGSYLNIKDMTVNAVWADENGMYLGCDGGLLRFEDEKPAEDDLTRACEGMRIRHIFEDQAGNLWISTYRDGLLCRNADGSMRWYNSDNSELTTDKIRCTLELSNHLVLAGTDNGIFAIDEKGELFRYLTEDTLDQIRVMTMIEDEDGTIYAGTDGYGIYVIRDRKVVNILTKEDGLITDVVMRLTDSVTLPGFWVVTGAGIGHFEPEDQSVKPITGMTIANSLDLLVRDDGKAIVLAGNGVFVVEEKELYEGNDLAARHYSHREGLPVDITANAWNVFNGEEFLICGSGGLAALNMDYEQIQKDVSLYVAQVTADDEIIQPYGDGTYRISSDTERISFDIRPIVYNGQAVRIGEQLIGQEDEMRFERAIDLEKNEYTNLAGGGYTYVVAAVDPVTQEELDRLELKLQKSYRFFEIPMVRLLLVIFLIGLIVAAGILLIRRNSKKLHGQYQVILRDEKEKVMKRMRYRDVVTGVYNRDMYEIDKAQTGKSDLFAVMTVSLNNVMYIRHKYSMEHENELIKTIADQLKARFSRDTGAIYRIQDNIFLILVRKPMDVEACISEIKKELSRRGEAGEHLVSVSAGLVYCDSEPDNEETLQEVVLRCDELRKLDAELEETRFVENMTEDLGEL